ncbi:MAG: DUF262 domain-containing protein [Alphaproteobacteria bacterium]|nr:MAG: DUF262 domain-containing protein [Alphaproteobacteria bacterium]
MLSPMTFTDPQVLYLSQILENIDQGIIEVPRFQRPLVWQWDQRLELFRSIRDGIPMGAILVWRTSETSVRSFDSLGPHHLASQERAISHQYLLDGVQRLSTLYSALFPFEGEDPDEDAYRVFFDLENNDFVTAADRSKMGTYLPLDIVLDSIKLLRFQRELDEGDQDRMIAVSDSIAKAFRTYKVPIIPITTDDVDLATRTFQRINSQGETMSEVHMLQALTWTSDFDLRERLESVRRDRLEPLGWSGVDDDDILKVCKAAFDLDVYEASVDEISSCLRDNPIQIDESVEAIVKAIDFLKSRCFVPSAVVLPYSLQLTVLAEAFRLAPEPDDELLDLLEAWFWTSTYGELFRGLSGYRLQKVISSMRDTVQFGIAFWPGHRPYERQPLKPTFDFRSARSKGLVLLLLRMSSRFGGDRSTFDLVGDAGRHGVVQLAPWVPRAKWISSPGNRFVMRAEEIVPTRDALQFGDEFVWEEIRRAHAIPKRSHDAALEGDWETFVHARANMLERVEASLSDRFYERFGIPI